jgi:hypothetical protein
MTFNEWLQIGINNRWCGPAICDTHDGMPLTEDESEMMWSGQDPCIHIIRLYESPEHAEGIEESHSPSMWRKIELSHLSSFQKEYGYKDKN